jgi:hypothetical protein
MLPWGRVGYCTGQAPHVTGDSDRHCNSHEIRVMDCCKQGPVNNKKLCPLRRLKQQAAARQQQAANLG